MHNMNRVMAATVACPAVGTHTAWKAQQQLRHGLQGSMSSTPLLSSLPLLRLSTSQMTATAVFPCVQRCQNLKMAVRLQHATPTREATVPSTSAHESSPSVSSSHDNLGGDDVRIDPRRLPGTIPGITQEELAARIVKYHSQRSRQVKEMSAKAVAQEVELMRRSLSPNAFAEYMAHLEEKQKAAAAEEARMAAMSTVELHHYQQKKRRQAARYQWYKTFLVISALLGSTVFLFSLFLFFKPGVTIPALGSISSVTGMAGAAVSFSPASSGGGVHPTRLLRRPQTMKPNPNEATSGQFEKSFEKMTDKIESRLPFRQHHVLHGNIYEQQYGDRSEHDMWQEAQEDLHGREKEKPAARQARSYFSEEDLSPTAMHVRSPQLKVAQNLQRQTYDKKILKTTAEPAAYYYPEMTMREKQVRRWKLIAVWSIVGVGTLTGLRHWGESTRTAG